MTYIYLLKRLIAVHMPGNIDEPAIYDRLSPKPVNAGKYGTDADHEREQPSINQKPSLFPYNEGTTTSMYGRHYNKSNYETYYMSQYMNIIQKSTGNNISYFTDKAAAQEL